jgi:hypothetical protein
MKSSSIIQQNNSIKQNKFLKARRNQQSKVKENDIFKNNREYQASLDEQLELFSKIIVDIYLQNEFSHEK